MADRPSSLSLPNLLTASRVVITVALFIPAFWHWRSLLAVGFAIATATDHLDGYLARRLGQTSYFGMRFDSLADYFLLASGLVWLWILEPSVFRAHPVMWITIALAVAVPQTICSIRTGRNAGFHLYSSKAAGWVAVIAFLHAILSGRHSDFLLYVFAVAVILNCSEESLVSLLVRDPYQNVRAYMQRGISKADRVLTPIASLRFLEATPG